VIAHLHHSIYISSSDRLYLYIEYNSFIHYKNINYAGSCCICLERFFNLKLVTFYLRSTQSQNILNYFALIYIKNDI